MACPSFQKFALVERPEEVAKKQALAGRLGSLSVSQMPAGCDA
jgi:hypothetical protein